MGNELDQQIAALQEEIERLTSEIARGKEILQTWIDTGTKLSLSASEARAKNQGAGRGLGGALLGKEYRSAVRRAAASSNAKIAQDVAAKRAKIAEGKRIAQEFIRANQAQLAEAKASLKALTAERRAASKTKGVVVSEAAKSLTLLQKLKEAHDLGLLTDEEYEDKRRKLAAQI